MALAFGGGASAAYASNPACPTATSSTATSCVFATAGTWTFTVPSGRSQVRVLAVGASGGAGKAYSFKSLGGPGARVQDNAVPVAPNAVLSVVVGSAGKPAGFSQTSGISRGHGGAGGTPGGGAGADASNDNPYATGYGGGGGGYSGLFDPSNNPLVIGAGGGGGGGGNVQQPGGYGGEADFSGLGGLPGNPGDANIPGGGGAGATPAGGGAGGSPGSACINTAFPANQGGTGGYLFGGQGGTTTSGYLIAGGGGGGGGYYGGGGGGSGCAAGGGGGGLSYAINNGITSGTNVSAGHGKIVISW